MNKKIFGRVLFAFGKELYNFQEQLYILIREMIPGLSRELLTNWEKDLGLPDKCSSGVTTQEERARIAHAKYVTKYSGLSKNFFLDYAKNVGSTIKIYELVYNGQPFRVNKNRVDRTPTNGINGARLWSKGGTFKWIVNILKTDPNKNYLHCRFMQIKPAHTELIWVEVDNL